jgi:uridine kinase
VSEVHDTLLQEIAAHVRAMVDARPVVVAIDGVDGAGKTTFADQLAATLTGMSVTTLRASVDGFHHPRAVRYRRGRHSPEGFYLDSFDYAAQRSKLLDPLTRDSDRTVVVAIYDVDREQAVEVTPQTVADDAVVVLDGIFLHRPELRGYWDLSIYLDVPFSVAVPRVAGRDGHGDRDPASPSNLRYVEGQRLYLARCQPARHATFVIDNRDLSAPQLVTDVS